MKARIVTMAGAAILAFAVLDLSAAAFAQSNTNQSGTNANRPRPRNRNRARTPSTPPTVTTVQTPAQPQAGQPTATPTRRRTRRRRPAGSAAQAGGIPTGVQACLDRLTQLASSDTLPDYEGQPSDIINNGLLWNDEKSKCSIGTDAGLRMRLFELSNAWRRKDAQTVRTTLDQIKSAAPQN